MREYYGDRVEIKKPLPREDASGISCEKAERMLGYEPKRSWRDYLDDEGRLKPDVKGHFSLLPFGSCPVALCGTAARTALSPIEALADRLTS